MTTLKKTGTVLGVTLAFGFLVFTLSTFFGLLFYTLFRHMGY
jgi:hypothetical protein